MQVEQLARDIQTGRGGVTIVQQPTGRGSGVVLYTVVVAGAGVLYLRFWRGWKFTDMMYVTRSSLNASLQSVSTGMEGLAQRLQNVKAFLQQQVGAPSCKARAAECVTLLAVPSDAGSNAIWLL